METDGKNKRLIHRLELQSHQIEQLLSRQQVPASISGGSVSPASISYDLHTSLAGGVERLRGLSHELATALGVPAVRVNRDRGRLRLSIRRNKQHVVDLLELVEGIGEPPNTSAILGLDYQDRPVMLNLESTELNNILITGGKGSGKSSLLRTIALSLGISNKQSAVQMAVIAPSYGRRNHTRRGSELFPLDYIPHLMFPVVESLIEAAEALDFLASEVAYREEQDMDSPLLVVIIDDLDRLLEAGGEPVRRPLAELLSANPDFGLRMVFAAGQLNQVLLRPLLKHNLPLRLVGQVQDKVEARLASGRPDSQAEYLRGPGDYLAVSYEGLLPFQSAFLDDYDLHLVLDEMHRQAKRVLLALPLDHRQSITENGDEDRGSQKAFHYDSQNGRATLEKEESPINSQPPSGDVVEGKPELQDREESENTDPWTIEEFTPVDDEWEDYDVEHRHDVA